MYPGLMKSTAVAATLYGVLFFTGELYFNWAFVPEFWTPGPQPPLVGYLGFCVGFCLITHGAFSWVCAGVSESTIRRQLCWLQAGIFLIWAGFDWYYRTSAPVWLAPIHITVSNGLCIAFARLAWLTPAETADLNR